MLSSTKLAEERVVKNMLSKCHFMGVFQKLESTRYLYNELQEQQNAHVELPLYL